MTTRGWRRRIGRHAGRRGKEVIDDGLLRRGVLNDGGLGGATISAGELVVSRGGRTRFKRL